MAPCASCGQVFPTSEMVPFSGSWVCARCKPAYFQRVRQGDAVGQGFRYGGFWRRFVAKVIDGIAQQGVMLPLQFGLAAAPTPGMSPFEVLATTGITVPVGIVLGVAYSSFFLGRFGATPGKMALGLKVVTPSGGPVSYALGAGRYFAELLSAFTCSIGYVMAAFDEERRALHDRVAGTRVVHTR